MELSVDGGHARVGYAVRAPLEAERQVARASREALVRATPFLRARLAALLVKRLPRLSFAFVGVGGPGAEGGAPWHD